MGKLYLARLDALASRCSKQILQSSRVGSIAAEGWMLLPFLRGICLALGVVVSPLRLDGLFIHVFFPEGTCLECVH